MRRHILLLVSLLVSFFFMLTLIFAFISGASFSGNGSGTPEDPYQITNCRQLQEIINWVSSSYVLMNDLNCQGIVIVPIAGFSGTFNGNGFKIYNLVSLANGLFESNSGNIQNVNLEGVSINSINSDVGGLVGKNNGGTIQDCSVSGNVAGFDYTGGLVGKNHGTMINSHSAARVSGNNGVGGLVGRNEADGTITNSYSIGIVNGGSSVGGLIGGNSGVVTSSFWDTETSGQTTSGGGIGKTTAEMKTDTIFIEAGWDFTNIWQMCDKFNEGYPSLMNFGSCVIYSWDGFFNPIDNLPTINQVNAGRAIPIKFSLGGNMSLEIFGEGYPLSKKIACDSLATLDSIEETVSAGGSILKYDSLTNQYTYVWKTEKSWKGTCRQLAVKLNDGTTQLANFKFTK